MSIQKIPRPEPLFHHLFGEATGHLVTFTAEQARFRDPDAPANKLAAICQVSWPYPAQARETADYLIDEAQLQRDVYFAVHLFKAPDTRVATYANPTVRALWLDEDSGAFPNEGPQPTAVIWSSRERRHLYWRLARSVPTSRAVELNRRIAVWAGGDTSKAARSSVLRAPGSANYKRAPEQIDLVGGHLTGVPAWEPEVIDQAVPEIPTSSAAPSSAPYDGPPVELGRYLASPSVQVLAEVSDGLGRKFRIRCPWLHEHSAGDDSGTYVGQRDAGGCWFSCNHQHCEGRTWREFRKKIRPLSRRVRITRPGYTGPDMETRIFG